MPDGLKLTVEEGKCIQASAYIPADNFTEYCIKKNVDIMFRISLAVLTECLSILGASEESSIKMYYKNDGSPLILMLQSQSYDNLITDCEIYTLSTSTILDFSDDDATEVSKIIVKPPAFLGLLADLERSSDVIELHFSPIHPNFSIITYGDQDRSCIDVPKSSDMVQSFSCDTTISFKYPFPLLRLIMKALAISSKMLLFKLGKASENSTIGGPTLWVLGSSLVERIMAFNRGLRLSNQGPFMSLTR
ncbi:Cell cycle checkpoint protein RAD1 [Eumeta japonica]|uniref:Cell cycle checkpoint protein RAD1 n=1 Tax=Eumeta variegata TaxID=151549 RepID=A0A4C1VUX1_EUMVA|nr:Cell cycle checkpoint protein RAD1 [Eumeta japonica]